MRGGFPTPPLTIRGGGHKGCFSLPRLCDTHALCDAHALWCLLIQSTNTNKGSSCSVTVERDGDSISLKIKKSTGNNVKHRAKSNVKQKSKKQCKAKNSVKHSLHWSLLYHSSYLKCNSKNYMTNQWCFVLRLSFYILHPHISKKVNRQNIMKMNTEFTLSTFEIINIVLHLLTLVIVASLFINTHKGDCRGVVVSQKQNPDGYWVTREAKLSMHESPHEL